MKYQSQTVGILGAGQMGRGIAVSCLMSGFKTFLYDKQDEILESSLEKIKISLTKLYTKNVISEKQREFSFANLSLQSQITMHADIFIEAVPEDYFVKEQLFKELSKIFTSSSILASNTSSLSITKLAEATPYPEKFIGLHFMNPAEIMPLVEIIPGKKTHQRTISEIELFSESLGKTAILSKDVPGFVVNRLLMPMINEAIHAFYQGIATASDIDKAMKLGANFPQGPLSLADRIGLDTCLSILKIMEKECDNPKYSPCPLLVKYVAEGKLGRKTNEGFYTY